MEAMISREGVSIVSEGRDGDMKPVADLILVHGLNGHPYSTWSYKSTTTTSRISSIFRWHSQKKRSQSSGSPQAGTIFWPQDLLSKDVKNVRILTYGYDSDVVGFFDTANRLSVYQHAQRLLFDLAAHRRDEPQRPIIFVAHSLGGIIVKDVLKQSADAKYKVEFQPILPSTFGIIFLATPHRGSDWAAIAKNLAIFALGKANRHVIQNLQVNNTELLRLVDHFSVMLKDDSIRVFSFTEGRNMLDIPGFTGKIVEPWSATIGDAAEISVPTSVDHRNIARYVGKDDSTYKGVLHALKGWLEQIENADRPRRCTPYRLDLFLVDDSSADGGMVNVRNSQPHRQDSIHFLHRNALEIYILLDPTYRTKSPPPVATGAALLGAFRETWMNLLNALNVESILGTCYMEEIPLDTHSLPEDVTNPLASTVEAVAVLSALIGCNSISWEDNVPQFLGPLISLQLTRRGPLQYVCRFEREPQFPVYYGLSSNSLTEAVLIARGRSLYRREILSLEPEKSSRLARMESSLRIVEDLGSVSGSDPSSSSLPAFGQQRKKLGLVALTLLAAESPWTVRAFPMEGCAIEDTLLKLLMWYTLHPRWQKKVTVAASDMIPHLGQEHPAGLQDVSAQELSEIAFCGDSFDYRAWNLFLNRDDGYELSLGWSWLDKEAQRAGRPAERPHWPVYLGVEDERLVLISGISLHAEQIRVAPSDTTLGWAFRRTLISCQIQELDWWLMQHGRATAACQTRLLVSAMECSETNESLKMISHVHNKDENPDFSHKVRGILVLRAILIGNLLASAMDLSSLYERNVADKLVLLQ